MNPPKLDVCIEGYNIEQTDFYISCLLEKCVNLSSAYEKSEMQIKKLEEENKKLKDDLFFLFKRTENSFNSRLDRIENQLKRIDNGFGFSETSDLSEEIREPSANSRFDDGIKEKELKEKLSEIREMLDSLNS
ncbi:MAG: hypothetical protein ACI4JG_01020 [Acutalibacteraceae bacterium]